MRGYPAERSLFLPGFDVDGACARRRGEPSPHPRRLCRHTCVGQPGAGRGRGGGIRSGAGGGGGARSMPPPVAPAAAISRLLEGVRPAAAQMSWNCPAAAAAAASTASGGRKRRWRRRRSPWPTGILWLLPLLLLPQADAAVPLAAAAAASSSSAGRCEPEAAGDAAGGRRGSAAGGGGAGGGVASASLAAESPSLGTGKAAPGQPPRRRKRETAAFLGQGGEVFRHAWRWAAGGPPRSRQASLSSWFLKCLTGTVTSKRVLRVSEASRE